MFGASSPGRLNPRAPDTGRLVRGGRVAEAYLLGAFRLFPLVATAMPWTFGDDLPAQRVQRVMPNDPVPWGVQLTAGERALVASLRATFYDGAGAAARFDGPEVRGVLTFVACADLYAS